MTGAARVCLAVVPFAAWAALAATAVDWRTAVGLAVGWWFTWLAAHASRAGLARFSGIAALGCAVGVMWVAARWATAPPWWVLPLALAVPAVLWWHAIGEHLPPDPRDEDEELDDAEDPPRRHIVVRDAGDSGVDVGGIDTGFDYPDEDHIARTPPPGWTPRSMVTGSAPVVGVILADDPPEAEVTEPFADLAGRVAAAWDGTKSVMHLDELAERMDRDKTLLRYDLDEAGVPVDPRAGKKVNGVKSVKAGVRWEAFEEWRSTLTTS